MTILDYINLILIIGICIGVASTIIMVAVLLGKNKLNTEDDDIDN